MVAFVLEVLCIQIIGNQTGYNYLALFLQGGIGAGSYYYPIMIQFIFIFPVIFFIVRKYRFKGLLLCLAMNAVYELLHWAYGMNEGCYRLIGLRYIFVIAFGVFLHYKEGCDEVSMKQYKTFLVLAFIIGACFIYLTCYTTYQPKIIIHWTRVSFVGSMYFVPIMDILLSKCKWKCKPLEILGQASFNIFLAQMVFFWIGAPFIYSHVASRKIQLLACVVICVVAGVAFYFVEQPITRWIVRKVKKIKM